jgi:hypothetical protein
LQQLWLLSEVWFTSNPATSGVPATAPKYDPNRREGVFVACHDAGSGDTQMTVYETKRDHSGAIAELVVLTTPGQQGTVVESPPLRAISRGFARGRARRTH